MEWVAEDGKARSNNFRRMLLTKCQKEFQKDKKDDESVESMQADIKKAETVRGKEGVVCMCEIILLCLLG